MSDLVEMHSVLGDIEEMITTLNQSRESIQEIESKMNDCLAILRMVRDSEEGQSFIATLYGPDYTAWQCIEELL